MSVYTRSERTDKKYTIGQAVESAKRRLNGKPMCSNAVWGEDYSTLITLERLNEISDEIVGDSNYYDNTGFSWED